MHQTRFVLAGVWLGLAALTMAADSRVPQWDARGLGPPPAQGIACLDVRGDGSRIVAATIALPGDENSEGRSDWVTNQGRVWLRAAGEP